MGLGREILGGRRPYTEAPLTLKAVEIILNGPLRGSILCGTSLTLSSHRAGVYVDSVGSELRATFILCQNIFTLVKSFTISDPPFFWAGGLFWVTAFQPNS